MGWKCDFTKLRQLHYLSVCNEKLAIFMNYSVCLKGTHHSVPEVKKKKGSLFWTHLGDGLHSADVRVWTEENVLQLGLLLVNSLHRQLRACLVFLGPFHLAGIPSAIRSLLLGRIVFC